MCGLLTLFLIIPLLPILPENPEHSEVYLLVLAHPGCPRQGPENHKMVVVPILLHWHWLAFNLLRQFAWIAFFFQKHLLTRQLFTLSSPTPS